jgi:hypothetical protein
MKEIAHMFSKLQAKAQLEAQEFAFFFFLLWSIAFIPNLVLVEVDGLWSLWGSLVSFEQQALIL